MQATTEVVVRVEGTLWDHTRIWPLAMQHFEDRFARMAPMPDSTDAPRPVDLARAVASLEAWGATAGVPWERELTRWFDDHLSLHVRPDPSISRSLRVLGGECRLVASSALPKSVTASLLRHAGISRAFAELRQEPQPPGAIAERTTLAELLGAL